mgnify:CR=1 FL=1
MSTALVAAEGRGLTSSRSCSPASLIRSTLACVDRIRVERQPCHPAIINTVVWLGHATPSGTPRPSPGRNVTSRGDSPFFPAPANADRSRRGQAAVICVPRPCARQPEEPARSPLGSPPTGQLAEPSSRLRRNVQLVVRAEKTPRRGAAGPWHARMRSAERKLSLHFGRRLRGERWAGESLDGRFASACLCRGVSRGIWSKSKLRRSSSRLQSSLQGRFTRVSSAGRDAIAT